LEFEIRWVGKPQSYQRVILRLLPCPWMTTYIIPNKME
jgi:hypothetical protein